MNAAVDRSLEPLLSAFVQGAGERLKEHANEVQLLVGDTWQNSETPRYAHFLRSGAISRILCTHKDQCTSVSLTIRGELLETLSAAGVEASTDRFRVILPGRALRVPFDLVREVLMKDLGFQTALSSQIAMQSEEAARRLAGITFHHVEARLVQYLVKLTDGCIGPIPITRESLADELGVHRISIAFVLDDLRKRGVLEYCQGKIEVLNRARLTMLACECNEASQQPIYDRMVA